SLRSSSACTARSANPSRGSLAKVPVRPGSSLTATILPKIMVNPSGKEQPRRTRSVLHMEFVDEPTAMEPASPHLHEKNNRGWYVCSPTGSSGVGSSSDSNGGHWLDAESEDIKVENGEVESAIPGDVEDDDEDGDVQGSFGAWSIVKVVPEMLLASEFAHGQPIDLSIQFTLCWMPFLALLGWWKDRPMHLLIGECSIVPQ
ncbi:hypothetical protein LXA43DRAFT_1129593, partial [Ganoderma leucocontextum]